MSSKKLTPEEKQAVKDAWKFSRFGILFVGLWVGLIIMHNLTKVSPPEPAPDITYEFPEFVDTFPNREKPKDKELTHEERVEYQLHDLKTK